MTGALEPMPYDAARYRRTLGHFASGLCVITAVDDATPVGFTCQSFSALSLDPALVMFCTNKSSNTWPRIHHAGSFCVNILAAEQQDYSRRFATTGDDKFEGLVYDVGPTGSPYLRDVIAHIDCRLEAVLDGGDHLIVVGRVMDLDLVREGAEPLVFYRATYGSFHEAQSTT